mgnify:CR=1 FL=1
MDYPVPIRLLRYLDIPSAFALFHCRLLDFVKLLAMLVTVGASSSLAHAQLSVLSQGDKPAKWKASQVATLQQQLADPKLAGELKLELQSQLKWLTAWEPGKLSDKPLWATEAQGEQWEEPALDPQGLAGELRELVHLRLACAAHNAPHSRRGLEQTPGFHAFHPPYSVRRLA